MYNTFAQPDAYVEVGGRERSLAPPGLWPPSLVPVVVDPRDVGMQAQAQGRPLPLFGYQHHSDRRLKRAIENHHGGGHRFFPYIRRRNGPIGLLDEDTEHYGGE
ncbi:hypothetical protein NHX12_019846 [Muraenolepis orangiensis]|uniref:Uncharacterized protein n=1 Tax=Muraenolepis orangiensis TaxID=630683 RepID=A0A9Q0IWZ2_9TELE|nr:hypothetical protein NHX12_019846 [Muraenolepis orangiensis]